MLFTEEAMAGITLTLLALSAIDPTPHLPPLTDVDLLPPPEVLREWQQRQEECEQVLQVHLERVQGTDSAVRVRYLLAELKELVADRVHMEVARDPTNQVLDRRLVLRFLRSRDRDAYNSGRWPPPVPLEAYGPK
jgi:hypothetical protein